MQNIFDEFTLTQLFENGTLGRIPLVQAGQTFRDLMPGTYIVTGGYVHIGYSGNGNTIRVIGIYVNDLPYNIESYNPNNFHINRNFASVLYELKQAGVVQCTNTNMDFGTAPQISTNMNYLISYKR